ncbi:MAG: hypothetical protein ACR2N2_11365 [Acidimicrobiia bacterium]
MDSESQWNFEVRKKCAKCDRLAVTFTDDDIALCARHATIFMTAKKSTESGTG